ncbi:MAG: helix-turn-helix transcriptional regulator [Clostridia bacterium]|nr:helix-turn-helix transcriptional regulator [Clostridia bacterium]
MSIIKIKHTDHEISTNTFEYTDWQNSVIIVEQTDPEISTINFEHTDQEYKNVPYQIHLNYSSEIHDYLSNWHNELEFVYTVSGSVEVHIENEIYITKPGDIVAINHNKVHTFKGDGWKFHCLKIAASILQTLAIPYNMFIPQPLIQDEELTSSFLDVVEEHYKDRIFTQQFKLLAIQRFLLLFMEKHVKNHFTELEIQDDTHFVISGKVLDYLNQHLSENFSIDDIAKKIGISSSHMSRCFKETTGISIVDHLNRLRCYTAKHYIMHTNKKIGEIAKLCGYQNDSYFAKTYKKFVGYTPNETPRFHLSK